MRDHEVRPDSGVLLQRRIAVRHVQFLCRTIAGIVGPPVQPHDAGATVGSPRSRVDAEPSAHEKDVPEPGHAVQSVITEIMGPFLHLVVVVVVPAKELVPIRVDCRERRVVEAKIPEVDGEVGLAQQEVICPPVLMDIADETEVGLHPPTSSRPASVSVATLYVWFSPPI